MANPKEKTAYYKNYANNCCFFFLTVSPNQQSINSCFDKFSQQKPNQIVIATPSFGVSGECGDFQL